MAAGAFIPLVFFVAIVGSVGFRLVRLWWRTRQVPEGVLGLGLVVLTGSIPLSAVGRVPAVALEPVGRVCFSAGIIGAAIGISLTAFFNYHVFRRGSSWALGLCCGICAGLLAGVFWMSAANFVGEDVEAIKKAMRPGTLSLMIAVLASFLWGGAESLHYHRAIRRQLAVGLGDPVLANRFLLWGTACVACSFLLLVIIGCVLSGMTILREPVPLGAIALAGSVMSAAWYLTFFAPERYQRFIREREDRAHPPQRAT